MSAIEFSHEILGRTATIRRLLALVRQVAPSDLAVHVTGETGSGKEKVARAIHAFSTRNRGPFVAVNAACLGEGLFESEVFGHARGAFTGAVSERRGLASEAEGGTLFIDEVVDLSPPSQAKLLRFLQEGEYRRLGEAGVRRGNVRIVSATNRPLEVAVARSGFRSDLLYRLSAVVVEVPPLRERAEDIEILAEHFLRRFAGQLGRRPLVLDRDALDELKQHRWPGNVRELENVMARLTVLCAGSLIGVAELAKILSPCQGSAARSSRGSLEERIAATEREAISAQLTRSGGRKAAAARALGISRQALHTKLRRLFPSEVPQARDTEDGRGHSVEHPEAG